MKMKMKPSKAVFVSLNLLGWASMSWVFTFRPLEAAARSSWPEKLTAMLEEACDHTDVMDCMRRPNGTVLAMGGSFGLGTSAIVRSSVHVGDGSSQNWTLFRNCHVDPTRRLRLIYRCTQEDALETPHSAINVFLKMGLRSKMEHEFRYDQRAANQGIDAWTAEIQRHNLFVRGGFSPDLVVLANPMTFEPHPVHDDAYMARFLGNWSAGKIGRLLNRQIITLLNPTVFVADGESTRTNEVFYRMHMLYQLLASVLNLLQELQEHSYVHCDLHPGNVMFGARETRGVPTAEHVKQLIATHELLVLPPAGFQSNLPFLITKGDVGQGASHVDLVSLRADNTYVIDDAYGVHLGEMMALVGDINLPCRLLSSCRASDVREVTKLFTRLMDYADRWTYWLLKHKTDLEFPTLTGYVRRWASLFYASIAELLNPNENPLWMQCYNQDVKFRQTKISIDSAEDRLVFCHDVDNFPGRCTVLEERAARIRTQGIIERYRQEFLEIRPPSYPPLLTPSQQNTAKVGMDEFPPKPGNNSTRQFFPRLLANANRGRAKQKQAELGLEP